MIENPYKNDELISALHKCIRADDIFLSSYFSKIIKETIGVWRVKQYLFYIVLEETLSISLFEEAYKLFLKEDDDITDEDIYNLIILFASTRKKWDYELGQDYLFKQYISFRDVNRGDYLPKIKNFDRLSYWENICEKTECFSDKTKKYKQTVLIGIPEILYLTEVAIDTKDTELLMKLGYLAFLNRKVFPFELLSLIKEFKDLRLYHLMSELKGGYSYVFNYMVLFWATINPMDEGFITIEDDVDSIKSKVDKAIETKEFIPIPAYANDEHTAKGRKLLKMIIFGFNKRLELVDLRFSGSIYGVLWRIASMKQHNKIENRWQRVFVPEDYVAFYESYISNKDDSEPKKIKYKRRA